MLSIVIHGATAGFALDAVDRKVERERRDDTTPGPATSAEGAGETAG